MDGSYSVEGTVYSSYTNQPAKMITVAEAAEMTKVTPRTIRKWIKKNRTLRTMELSSDLMLLDYEVQYWLDNYVNKTYPKRS